jgi:hypothetical protein
MLFPTFPHFFSATDFYAYAEKQRNSIVASCARRIKYLSGKKRIGFSASGNSEGGGGVRLWGAVLFLSIIDYPLLKICFIE